MIDSVNSSKNVFGANKASEALEKRYSNPAKSTSQKAGVSSDKLELSSEAKKLQPILQRLNNGFYDREEIIQEVAVRIDLELAETKKEN